MIQYFFFPRTYIYIDTNTDHFTLLMLTYIYIDTNTDHFTLLMLTYIYIDTNTDHFTLLMLTYIYIDTNTDHFTLLMLRVQGNYFEATVPIYTFKKITNYRYPKYKL